MGGENHNSTLISAEFKREATNNKNSLVIKLVYGVVMLLIRNYVYLKDFKGNWNII